MLLCLTANHRNASFELLEKLSLGAPGATESLVHSDSGIYGAVVLATCNRFEAYLDVADGTETAVAARAVASISSASGIAEAELDAAVSVLEGDRVVRHLFSVSSGLESVVVGEAEISGQVRRALQRSRAHGTSSSALERVFQKATETSRGVKSRTALTGAGRSLVRLSLELASSRITDWASKRVLIVGTGQYAAATVTALRDRGAHNLFVYSSIGRAASFGARYGVQAVASLEEALEFSDLVITCTSRAVISAEMLRPSDHRRLIIDLGMPRNVDPNVAHVDGVELLDLETIRLHAPLDALSATVDAREIVGSAARAFSAERSAEPAVVALRTHLLGVLDAEIARARSRGDSSEHTEAALRHLMSVLLHTPSVRAKELAAEGRLDEFIGGLAALYGVHPAPDASSTQSCPASA